MRPAFFAAIVVPAFVSACADAPPPVKAYDANWPTRSVPPPPFKSAATRVEMVGAVGSSAAMGWVSDGAQLHALQASPSVSTICENHRVTLD